MALPQKAIEQLGREPVKTPGWSGRILMLTSSIFLIAVAAYIGIRFGYRPYLQERLDEVQFNLESFAQRIPVAQQQQIITFYSQLVNVRKILDDEKLPTEVFSWLEGHTQANVAFTQFGLNFAGDSIALQAQGRTLEDVIQQVVSLEELPELRGIEFPGVTRSEETGFWGFQLNLQFAPNFFKSRTGTTE